MRHLFIAAALALAPGAALADHNHGGHGGHGAHDAAPTMLSASTPSDGAVLAEAPRSLSLLFQHPVTLQSVRVTGPAGAVATDFRESNASTRYAIGLPSRLAAGAYEAHWTASAEGHQMTGVIRFTVQ